MHKVVSTVIPEEILLLRNFNFAYVFFQILDQNSSGSVCKIRYCFNLMDVNIKIDSTSFSL